MGLQATPVLPHPWIFWEGIVEIFGAYLACIFRHPYDVRMNSLWARGSMCPGGRSFERPEPALRAANPTAYLRPATGRTSHKAQGGACASRPTPFLTV